MCVLEDRIRAGRMFSLLKADPDGSLMLDDCPGGESIHPLTVLRNPLHHCVADSVLRARISYNKGGDDDSCLLTYHKRPFAVICSPGVVRLERVLRAKGFHMLVRFHASPGRGVKVEPLANGKPGLSLLLPSRGDLDELVRLVRLHGRWPVPLDVLAGQYAAERIHERVLLSEDHFEIGFSGVRHAPPSFFADHLFWTGYGTMTQDWPEPGDRRVPVSRLVTTSGATLLAAKPHDVELCSYLSMHRRDLFRIAYISDITDKERKPTHSLAFAPASPVGRLVSS